MDFATEAVKIIKEKFDAKKRRLNSYSLRAFARDLDISPASLSRLMTDQKVSHKSILKIIKSLKLTSSELTYLTNLYQKEGNLLDENQFIAKKFWENQGKPKSIDKADFKQIASLDTLALYNYLFYNSKISFPKIKKGLGLSKSSAQASLSALAAVSLIDYSTKIEAVHDFNFIQDIEVGEENLKFNLEIIENCKAHLLDEDLQTSEDYIMSSVFVIRDDKLEKAREFLNSCTLHFFEEYCESVESVEEGTEYSVGIMLNALNILTKKEKAKP